MKELTLKEIQNKCLELLTDFDRICRENNINYSLCGGTLIGAVRHKGFIPWDDDVDVMMNRENYDRFIDYCKSNKTSFVLMNGDVDDSVYYLYTRICDTETQYVNPSFRDRKEGVFLDIFPMDEIGDDLKEFEKKNKKMNRDRFFLMLSAFKSFPYRYFNWDNIKLTSKIFMACKYYCGRLFRPADLYNDFWKEYRKLNYRNSKFVSTLSVFHYGKVVLERKWFDEYTDLDFEGHRFMAIKDYVKYLEIQFGDYMTLPPEDKRGNHHHYKIFWK